MKLGVSLAVVCALSLGCGESSNSNSGTSDQSLDRCEDIVGEFLESLEQINSRLSVGLNYDEYGDFVGDARVAYDRIDTEQLKGRCLEDVGLELENTFNRYVEALQAWDRCIDRISCDVNDNDAIQQDWNAAEISLQRAQEALP